MADLENKLELKIIGSPYFIHNIDQELFNIVQSVEISQEKNITFIKFDQENKLILGRDMLEVPTRRLILAVEHLNDLKNIYRGFSVIEECRKLAKLCQCDYVTTEPMSGNYSFNNINNSYSIFYPRLFRKIIDN